MRFSKYISHPLLGLLLASSVFALQAQEDKLLWNFDNADIQTVIKQVAEQTGKNFIIDPRVQGKVTVISQQPLNPDGAYEVLLSVLRVHGFEAVETEDAIKIIPQDSANNDAGDVVTRNIRDNDQQVIRIFPLKFLPSTEVVPSIKQLIPRTSNVVAIESTNQLIVSDTASNILKVEKVLKQLDNNQSQMVRMIHLNHASADEVVSILVPLLRERTGSRSIPIFFAADTRTNSILVSGGSPEQREYIEGVIHQLDAPSASNANSEVIYLKYVDASSIAPIIAAFLEEALQTSKEEEVRSVVKEKTTQSTMSASSAETSTSSSFPAAHLQALRNYQETEGRQGALFEENEKKPQSGIVNRFVQWEESVNALIVKAPPAIMPAIKSIIAKLDIRRPQVIIEVVIAEINLDRLEEYGVEWDVSPNASIKYGTRFFTNNGIVGGFAGGAVSQLGEGLSVGVFRHGNLRALIRMLATDTSANILSTPTLVTLDNKTALIKVGEKVPFAVGQTNNDNTGGNPFTSFDREEVGLSLTIKPQIINRHEIKLQIENILSNIVANSANANTGGNPTTSERTIITNVLVNEGKILVLGGLIQDSWQEVKTKVPFIGSIPFAGELFKRNKKELVKKNLMIFLRPKIIHDDTRGIRISTSKYEQMRNAELESYDVLNHPLVNEPVTLDPLAKNDYYKGKPYPEYERTEVILPPPFEVKCEGKDCPKI